MCFVSAVQRLFVWVSVTSRGLEKYYVEYLFLYSTFIQNHIYTTFSLYQILMLSTVYTLWFLVNFTKDTFTGTDLPTELNIWDPHAPPYRVLSERNTCTPPREQCGCWWQRWAVMEAVACFCEWHHDKWGASTTNCQSVVSRTSNEGSRTFHNHGEGPY